MYQENLEIIAIVSIAINCFIPLLVYYVNGKAREKYILLGIRQAYTDMSRQCNKIQYIKVKYLFTEMINNIKNGK